ncbi:C-type lectin domain family 10 member A-like [Gadus morhua]|uniref:C-type lectin domain family 10 member A-like n=1 Tax=Gadus morhua TaxID=8049 RepID=UPI0011B7BED8|nr:C-type lectin domain family 10 member A-like [Gadus morhua]
MQQTESDYINAPSSSSNDEDARETEKSSCFSALGVCRVVGVSLGLLCVLQATLNISLRLHKTSEAFSFGRNCAANATTDWAVKDLVSMRFHLISQRQMLQRAHDNLEAKFRDCSLALGDRICRPDVEIYIQNKDFYNMVVRERDELKDQISRQRNVVMELQRQRNRLLLHISKLDPSIPSCPPEWTSEQSSCYLLSSSKGTWDSARQDCLVRGAHLVTVNSQQEQELILTIGFLVDRFWIGLLQSRAGELDTVWEDGSAMEIGDDEEKHFSELSNRRMRTCAYLDQKEMEINALRSTFCGNMNHWLSGDRQRPISIRLQLVRLRLIEVACV